MAALFGVLGLLGVFVCLIWLIVSAIRKKPKRPSALGLAACFLVFVICMAVDTSAGDGGSTSTGFGRERMTVISVPYPTATPSPAERDLMEIDAPPETEAPQIAETPATEQPTTVPVESSPAQFPEVVPDSASQIAVETTPAQTVPAVSYAGAGSGNDNNFNTYDNTDQQRTEDTYVLNTKSMKIHTPGCSSVPKIAPENYTTTNSTISELEARGYTKCGQKDEPWN